MKTDPAARARQARRDRRAIKDAIAGAETSRQSRETCAFYLAAIDTALTPTLPGMRLHELLSACRDVGPERRDRLLRTAGAFGSLKPETRLRDLTRRQRVAMIDVLLGREEPERTLMRIADEPTSVSSRARCAAELAKAPEPGAADPLAGVTVGKLLTTCRAVGPRRASDLLDDAARRLRAPLRSSTPIEDLSSTARATLAAVLREPQITRTRVMRLAEHDGPGSSRARASLADDVPATTTSTERGGGAAAA